MNRALHLRDVNSLRSLLAKLRDEQRAVSQKKLELPLSRPLEVSFAGFNAWAPEVHVQLSLFLIEQMRNGRDLHLAWTQRGTGVNVDGYSALRGYETREFILSYAAGLGRSVTEEGYADLARPPVRSSDTFIPLRHLKLSHFVASEPVFEASPQLMAHESQAMAIERLVTGGFLTTAQVELFRVSLFLEVAWNAILHSETESGRGWCVFAGCTRGRPRSKDAHFWWSVGDSGRGIVAALARTSREDWIVARRAAARPDPGERSKLHDLGSRDVTSRTAYPPGGADQGNRGYRHIAEVAGRNGELQVLSSGTLIALAKTPAGAAIPRWKTIHDYGTSILPGTVVSGSLRELAPEDFYRESGVLDQDWPERAGYACLVSHGIQDRLDLEEVGPRLKAAAKPNQRLVIDVGFMDTPPQAITRILGLAIRDCPGSPVVVANARSVDQHTLRTIGEELRRSGSIPALPVLFSTSGRVWRSVTIRPGRVNVSEIDMWVQDASLTDDHLVLLSNRLEQVRRANSEYLRLGIASADANGGRGFFRAKIRLLSGATVGGYFALARNASSADSSMARWASSVAIAIDELIRATRTKDRIVVLAFSVPMEKVAREAVRQAADWAAIDAIVVRSFEPPTRRELAKFISNAARVILLTDVVVTGSQLQTFSGVVNRLGAKTIGAIAAVDLSADAPPLAFPLISLGRFDLPEDGPMPELVVDPVSLIPRGRAASAERIVKRSRESLEVIRQSRAVMQGHYDPDGWHATFYVRVADLLEGQEHPAIQRLVISSLAELDDSDFRDFSPAIVVTPRGVPGVVSLKADEPIDDHQRAFDLLRHLIVQCRPDWREALQSAPFILERFYDSTGGMRCSLPADYEEIIEGADVLFIDDAASTGRTVRGLIDQLTLARPKRILTLALLGRLRIEDLVWLEGVSQIRGRQGKNLPFRFVAPLVIPVSLFRPEDCPIGFASSTIRPYLSWGTDIATSAQSIISSLKATPLQPTRGSDSDGYLAGEAMYVRGMLELASEDPTVNVSIRDEITTGASSLALAMLSVVSVEPRLLFRPRLHSWLAIESRSRALEVIADHDAPALSRVDGLTLVRTAFPERFSDAVRALASASDCPANILVRCAFQALSLDEPTRNDVELLHAIEALRGQMRTFAREKDPESEDAESYRRANHIFERILWIATKPDRHAVATNLADAVQHLLEALREDDDFHELAIIIYAIADQKLPPTPETIRFYIDGWAPCPDPIKRTLLPLIDQMAKYLEPFVAGATHALSQTIVSSPLAPHPLPQLEDLQHLADERGVFADVANIGFWLDTSLSKQAIVHSWPLRQASEAAQRLNRLLFAKDSTCVRLGQSLSSLDLQAAVDAMTKTIQSVVVNAKIDVRVHRNTRTDALNRTLLVRPDQWEAICAALSANIAQHAVSAAQPEPIAIVIDVRRQPNGLQIRIADTGAKRVPEAQSRELSPHTRRLNAQLASLGGFLRTRCPPGETLEIDGLSIPVKQAVGLEFTPEALRNLCAR